MKTKVWQDLRIESLEEAESKRILKGRAINYNSVTLNGTLFRHLKFIETLPALFNHNRDIVIGNVKFSNDTDGINFEMTLNPNTADGKEAWEKVKHGDLTGVSIGAFADEWTFEEIDDEDVFVIESGELFELSLVTVPADPNARIKEIQSLKEESSHPAKDVSRETKKGGKLNLKEKAERIKSLEAENKQLKTVADKVVATEDFESLEEARIEVAKITEAREQIEANKTEIKQLTSEALEESASIEALLNSNLNSSKKTKKEKNEGGAMDKKTTSKQMNEFLNQPHIVEAYKEKFVEAAKEGKSGLESFKKYLESNHKEVMSGFSGALTDLTPLTVIGDVADTMQATGYLTPFIDVMNGITGDLAFPINTGEDLGYGWQGDSAVKNLQSNVIEAIKLSLQYIYKRVDVSREWLDQPNDVIYNYIIKELAQRLQLTIERSNLVGDPDGTAAKDVIKSFKPIKRDADISVKHVSSTLTDVSLRKLDAQIKYRVNQTIFVASATVIAEIAEDKNDLGMPKHVVSETVIEGRTYTTIDNYIFVESMFMPETTDLVAGEMCMLAFKSKSLVNAFKNTMAEMFQDFKLETNTREFLTEVKAAGDLVKPSCALVINYDDGSAGE